MTQQMQIPWIALRTAVTADDAALATFDYDSWPSTNTLSVKPDSTGESIHLLDARRWIIAAYGVGNANVTAGYKLYARRKTNGPILLLASGILTLGAQVVTKDPITREATAAKWVDTITVAGGIWSDIAPVVIESGTDRIALLRGANDGIRDLYCQIDLNSDGLGSYMTEVNLIITGREDE